MKVSWSWLGDLVELPPDPTELAARLTKAGLEVETVVGLGTGFTGVVVAEVLARRPHPKSAKLTLVTVNDGSGPTEVVCGAANVPAAGGKVLWARPGSRLPDGRTLSTKEVAGVASPGMLCSAVELGLGEDGAGIVVLDGDDAAAAPGTAAQDALGLRDFVLDIAVPANRPDGLGHLGIARELGALLGRPARRPDATLAEGPRVAAELTSVAIADAEGCPRYTARLIEGVRVGPSPRWLRRRLEAVGVRPISNLVDVSNYVMFELGHPLHAFDADKLKGGIRVRRAERGERLVTLDGQERVLEPTDLLICDDSGPIALAGVMGGAATEVTAATTRVLLEAATFAPLAIRRTARRLGLLSEASHRFERGVDAAGVELASARAAKLMAELAGGHVARGVVDVYLARPAPRVIELRPHRVNALLGVALETEEIGRCLRALELDVEPGEDRLVVSCPTFRSDLEREVDLIEEVARIHGLDDVPATLPPLRAAPEGRLEGVAEAARDTLVGAGLDEAQCFGFTAPARIAALRFGPDHIVSRPLLVRNPMREEQGAMRTSLLPNLLGALAHNLAFGLDNVRIFEVGHVFLANGRGGLPDEPLFVAGLLTGARPGWLKPAGPVDFYDTKGVVERLLAALGAPFAVVPARSEEGFLHPGIAAAILVHDQHVGVVGEVHPETRDAFGIDRPCFAFELCLDRIPAAPALTMKPINRFPAILRDVSFFVDETVPAARIEALLLEGRPPILEEIRVIEDYREAGKVPLGKKGMLWSLTYRAPAAEARTLTDAEVDAAHEALVTGLLSALRAERR
jgi:phenylalanyl-tRNA synthetase beta chain